MLFRSTPLFARQSCFPESLALSAQIRRRLSLRPPPPFLPIYTCKKKSCHLIGWQHNNIRRLFFYLPIQKSLNKTSNISSTPTLPVSLPMHRIACRSSSAPSSTAKPASWVTERYRSKCERQAATCSRCLTRVIRWPSLPADAKLRWWD